MKKFLLIAVLALFSASAFAQKDVFGFGVNFNYTPCLEDGADLNHFGISGKMQYGFTDALRAEVSLGYDFEEKNISVFEAGASLHYLFHINNKFRVYPIAGIGYANLKYDIPDTDDDEVYFNFGGGVEYDITKNIAIGAEVKYQIIDDFNRLPMSIGLTYKF